VGTWLSLGGQKQCYLPLTSMSSVICSPLNPSLLLSSPPSPPLPLARHHPSLALAALQAHRCSRPPLSALDIATGALRGAVSSGIMVLYEAHCPSVAGVHGRRLKAHRHRGPRCAGEGVNEDSSPRGLQNRRGPRRCVSAERPKRLNVVVGALVRRHLERTGRMIQHALLTL